MELPGVVAKLTALEYPPEPPEPPGLFSVPGAVPPLPPAPIASMLSISVQSGGTVQLVPEVRKMTVWVTV
jgi:hypothetical protein